jgi:hypothetical protein
MQQRVRWQSQRLLLVLLPPLQLGLRQHRKQAQAQLVPLLLLLQVQVP